MVNNTSQQSKAGSQNKLFKMQNQDQNQNQQQNRHLSISQEQQQLQFQENSTQSKKPQKKVLSFQEEQILREKREDFILDLQEHYDSVSETLEKLIYIKKELNDFKVQDQEKTQFKKMLKKDIQTTQDLIKQMDQIDDNNILGQFTTKFILFGYKQALQDLLELMNIILRIELDQNELQSLKIQAQKHKKGVNLMKEIKNSTLRVQKLKVGNRLKTVLDQQQEIQLKQNKEEKEKFEKQEQLKKKQRYDNNRKMNELLDYLNDENYNNIQQVKMENENREKDEEQQILNKFMNKKQIIEENEENFNNQIEQRENEKKMGDSLFLDEEEGNREQLQNDKQIVQAEIFQEKEKNLRQMISSFMKVSKDDPNFSYKYQNLDLYFKERFSLQTLYLGQQQLEDFIDNQPTKNQKQQLDKQKNKQQKEQINLEEIQIDPQLTALHRINLINQEITDELNKQFHDDKMKQINKIYIDHHKDQWSKKGGNQKNQQNKNQLQKMQDKPFVHVRPLMTKQIMEKLEKEKYKEEDKLLAEGTVIPIQQLYLNSHPNNPFLDNLYGNSNNLNGNKIMGSTFSSGFSGNRKFFKRDSLFQSESGGENTTSNFNLFTEQSAKNQANKQNQAKNIQLQQQQNQGVKIRAQNSIDKGQLQEYFSYLRTNRQQENSQLSTLNSTQVKSPKNDGTVEKLSENKNIKFKAQSKIDIKVGQFKLNQDQNNQQQSKQNCRQPNRISQSQSQSYLQLNNDKIKNNSSLNFLQKYEFLKNQSSSINNRNQQQYNYENFYKQNINKQKVVDLNDIRTSTAEKPGSQRLKYYLGGNKQERKKLNGIDYLQQKENDNVTLYLSRYGTSKIRMTSPGMNKMGNYNTNFNFSTTQSSIKNYNFNQQNQDRNNLNFDLSSKPAFQNNRPGTTFEQINQKRENNYTSNTNHRKDTFNNYFDSEFSQTSQQFRKQQSNSNQKKQNLLDLTKTNGDQWIMQ